MKHMRLAGFLLVLPAIMACLASTPSAPIAAETGTEFTLAPGQTALVTRANLVIQLVGVTGDDRCPAKIECAMSGPVSFALTVQMGNGDVTSVDMQVFTDTTGRAPEGTFEGIHDRVEYEGYEIRVTGVLPYPQDRTGKINGDDYRVTVIVSKK